MDIIGYVIGIIGIIIAFIIYFLSKKDKKPVFLVEKVPVIGQKNSLLSEEDKIKIFFNDAQVEQVSICNITLRNLGKETIDKDDIAQSDPLRVVFDEHSKILKVHLLKVTREPINFKIIDFQNNILNLTFDFLDYNDGALIKVLYDGSASVSPVIKGTIKGAPTGFLEHKPGIDEYSKFNTIFSLILIMSGLAFAYYAFSPYIFQGKALPELNLKTILGTALIAFFEFVLIVGGITLFKSNYKSKKYKNLFLK